MDDIHLCNGRVKVIACVACGVAKGSIPDNVDCATLSIEDHHIKKMGWEILSDVV